VDFSAVSTPLPPLPPPSHPNASRRWTCLAFQYVCHHYYLPRVQTRTGGGPFDVFNATATASTPLASKCEPAVDLSGVSTRLAPPPPPSHPNTSQRWTFNAAATASTSLASKREPEVDFLWRFDATTSFGGVFFPRSQRRRGGVKPTHRRVRMFSGLLGRRVTSPPCLLPPNNNEGWPPCGVNY